MSDPRYDRIAERVHPGATVEACRELTGGVSATIEALDLRLPDGTLRRVVVRQQGTPAAGDRPVHSREEFAILTALYSAGLAVPEPIFVDESLEVLPVPYVVMAFVEGVVHPDPGVVPGAVEHMAEVLAGLHRIPVPAGLALSERVDAASEALVYLPEDDAQLREAVAAIAPRTERCLVHGDFWTHNLLWRDGRIVAVLDWEDAAIGDPLSDVAGARLELLWHAGADAMERFTDAYVAASGRSLVGMAVWELIAGHASQRFMGGWGLEPAFEAQCRERAQWFAGMARGRLLPRS